MSQFLYSFYGKNEYSGLMSRYTQLYDKHLIYSVVMSRISAVVSNTLISSYFNILENIAN